MSTPDDARDADSPDGDEAQDPTVPAAAGAGAVNLSKESKSSDSATGSDSKQNKENKPAKKKAKDPDRKGVFARFALFLRQVMAELRKVIWPTRSELINYTAVVLVFVVIMALILAAYDFAFARAVFFIFDN